MWSNWKFRKKKKLRAGNQCFAFLDYSWLDNFMIFTDCPMIWLFSAELDEVRRQCHWRLSRIYGTLWWYTSCIWSDHKTVDRFRICVVTNNKEYMTLHCLTSWVESDDSLQLRSWPKSDCPKLTLEELWRLDLGTTTIRVQDELVSCVWRRKISTLQLLKDLHIPFMCSARTVQGRPVSPNRDLHCISSWSYRTVGPRQARQSSLYMSSYLTRVRKCARADNAYATNSSPLTNILSDEMSSIMSDTTVTESTTPDASKWRKSSCARKSCHVDDTYCIVDDKISDISFSTFMDNCRFIDDS